MAETTELAVKASRRPNWKSSTIGNPTKGPNQQNRGQGQGRGLSGSRGGYRGGSSVGSSGSTRGNSGGRRGSGGRGGGRGYAQCDPLACYRCGVRGHLARDCPQAGATSQGSGNAGPSQRKFSQSGQKGPKGRGRGRQIRFGGLNVLYDDEGNSYPIDDAGQLYVPLDFGQSVAEPTEEENLKEAKN